MSVSVAVPGFAHGVYAEKLAELRLFYPQLEAVESVIACGLSSLNPIIHVPGCILNADIFLFMFLIILL